MDQETKGVADLDTRYLDANASGSSGARSASNELYAVRQSSMLMMNHGESEMKITDVLAKVYDPERLQLAWQQVRKNAGAAGIDQMTVEEFAEREETLLSLIHDKLSSGIYQFQPARRAEILVFLHDYTLAISRS
jgi:retron-type reverse transcriptase